MTSRNSKMITVLGPTATGKTKLAARLAYKLDAGIISADSRQVYRGMDIGTGKDLSEYMVDGTEIPCHMIDIAEPGEEYNVFRYQQDVHAVIEGIKERGKKIILCGGSGMYIEAVLKGYKLFPVPLDPSLRKELEKKSEEELIRELAAFRSLHNHTDTCEHDRLIRAIEIEYYYREHPHLQEISRPVPSVVFGLTGDRDLIRAKITRRLKERLDEGMVEEVESLISQGVDTHQLIRYGLEYKYVTLFLQHKIDKDELFRKLNIAIHQFSKRQMTWFRKMERSGFDIHWLDISMPENELTDKMISIYTDQCSS